MARETRLFGTALLWGAGVGGVADFALEWWTEGGSLDPSFLAFWIGVVAFMVAVVIQGIAAWAEERRMR